MPRQNSMKTGMDVLNAGIERLCEEGRRIKAEEERRLKTLDLVDELDRVFGDNFHRSDRRARACMFVAYNTEHDGILTTIVFPFHIKKEGNNYFVIVSYGHTEKNMERYGGIFKFDISRIVGYDRMGLPY